MSPTTRAVVVTLLALAAGACATAPPDTSSAAGDGTAAPAAFDPAAGLPYACDGPPFDVRVFARPPGDEREASPTAAALRDLLLRDPSMPQAGWWLVSRTGTRAQYLSRSGDAFSYVNVESVGGARWRASGWGGCLPTYAAPPRATLTWMVDPARRPAADDRSVRVVVVDMCDERPLDHRLGEPTIRTTSDAVLIIFTATRPNGAAIVASIPRRLDTADICFAPIPFEATVALGEPLGNRRLLDGARWPPRDATIPLEP